jgi:hypothetical protein
LKHFIFDGRSFWSFPKKKAFVKKCYATALIVTTLGTEVDFFVSIQLIFAIM